MQIKSFFKQGLLAASSFSLLAVSGVVASAQPTNPGGINLPTLPSNFQTTASTASVESPTFGLDLTACRAEFDWEQYIQDSQNGIQNSAPYNDQDCVVQTGIVQDQQIQQRYYKDFAIGSAETKAAFGNDPVIGIFPNTGADGNTYTAQGIQDKTEQQINSNFDNVDRSKLASLTNVFTQQDLNEIYSTTGGQYTTGIPRIYSTGPDQYTTNAQNQQVYQGGWCYVENGEIKVRTERQGVAFNPGLYGRDVSTPETSCARNGQDRVEDRNLQVYQFVFEIPYPTADQCNEWWGVDAETCNTFYQNALGRQLAGDTAMDYGDRLVYAYTFYGSFDDQYSKWVRWATPDVGNRADATDGFIRSYNGYTAFEMDN